MIKFILRRSLQAIPTLIGITVIAYLIMFLAPGNPASQLAFDPELTAQQRAAIRESLGVNDPFHVQYMRWLFGDAPYIFFGTPAWNVELDNGESLILRADNGELIVRDTFERNENGRYLDVSLVPVPGNRVPGSTPFNPREVRSMAEDIFREDTPDARVASVGYLPDYNGFILWEGRPMPIFDRAGNRIGEQVGVNRGVVRFDFGVSPVSRKPALEAIFERVPASLELGLISLVVGLLIGLPVGVLAAVWQGSIFDQATRVLAVLVSSIPVFWLGLILLLIFGSQLQWLPMGNRFPLSFTGDYTVIDRIRHLILPVFTLSSFTIATFSRYMRASLLDVLNQDYVRTAHAKGLNPRVVWFKHGMRNALIPIATILGPSITLVISGAVLTETIYAWPGMGRLLVDSVRQLDYNVIMGVIILLAIATIIGYMLSDMMYALFDPRVRLS